MYMFNIIYGREIHERKCKILERIVNSDNPLEALKENVGNKTLNEWLEIGYGEALSECMRNTESTCDVLKYLIIVDAIVPPVPKFMVNSDHKHIFRGSSIQNSDLGPFERLIDAIYWQLLNMINNINTKIFPEGVVGCRVLLKVVYYAGKRTIATDIPDSRLLDFIENHLEKCCSDFAHTAMALIIVLFEKMPKIRLKQILKPEIFLQMKMIVTQNDKNKCLHEIYLRKLYFDLSLEEKFYDKFPTFKKLQDTVFNEHCLTSDLRCVAQIITGKKFELDHFILSGLLHKFHSLLSNPSEIGDQTFVIKSFLTVFLSFETGIEGSYTWKSNLFGKLVWLVVANLDYILLRLNHMRTSCKEVNTDSPLSTIGRIRNDAVITVKLLESLHILNGTWYQWFDIVFENKIIEDNLFESSMLYASPKYLDEQIKDAWRMSLIKTCFATVSRQQKHLTYAKLLPKPQGIKHFKVSRSNVLSDVFNLIRLNADLTSCYWSFTFEDEIGTGPGVRREVYSILSEELQMHYHGLWREEPFKMSDNEMIHAHSPDGVFQKDNDETEKFELLGKIMAKALLDGQCLDIPISNEFFQRLRTSHFKNYSHLRRDYFDLIQTFPMIETLFKQLLPVKRKVESIRAEVGLSPRQKQEIISNLTFDDGNSFDDFYLNFTVPGTNIELIEGGRDVILSPHNIDLYCEKLCALKVQLYSANQFEAIRDGFDKVFSPGNIDFLLPEELKRLICGDEIQRWTEKDLSECCVYMESPSVQFLFQCLASFDAKRQKLFLRFVTGRSFLPYGGLSGLEPRLTITRIYRDHADSSLPSASTCSNTLHLPDYSSLSITRQNLLHAIEEGNDSFAFG